MPGYKSQLRSRCEELAEKIINVSSDYESVLKSLLQIRDEAFAEGYDRCSFDLRYQREKREGERQKEWRKVRDSIVFRGK